MSNRLIAEFMGMTRTEHQGRTIEYSWNPCPINKHWPCKAAPPFNTSWDWLMPVVTKIQTLKKYRKDGKDLLFFSSLSWSIHIDGYRHSTHAILTGYIMECHNQNIPHGFTKHELPHISITNKENIKAVYDSVLKFINWYNKLIFTEQS